MEGFRFLGVKRSVQRKPTKVCMESANQFTYKHWLAVLVKGKCLNTKSTRLTTGVVHVPFHLMNIFQPSHSLIDS